MIDKNKQYKTRSGSRVQIYGTDAGGDYPVHGAILDPLGSFDFYWTKDGSTFIKKVAHYDLDLVEIDCKEGEGL